MSARDRTPDPQALAALPQLPRDEGGPVSAAEPKEAWADAYRHTPHGKPIELRSAPVPDGDL